MVPSRRMKAFLLLSNFARWYSDPSRMSTSSFSEGNVAVAFFQITVKCKHFKNIRVYPRQKSLFYAFDAPGFFEPPQANSKGRYVKRGPSFLMDFLFPERAVVDFGARVIPSPDQARV